MSHWHWFKAGTVSLEVPGRPAYGRPVGLGFGPFFLIFGRLVPTAITHPKVVALVRNKQNMYKHSVKLILFSRS